jgi:hypothetical protein
MNKMFHFGKMEMLALAGIFVFQNEPCALLCSANVLSKYTSKIQGGP